MSNEKIETMPFEEFVKLAQVGTQVYLMSTYRRERLKLTVTHNLIKNGMREIYCDGEINQKSASPEIVTWKIAESVTNGQRKVLFIRTRSSGLARVASVDGGAMGLILRGGIEDIFSEQDILIPRDQSPEQKPAPEPAQAGHKDNTGLVEGKKYKFIDRDRPQFVRTVIARWNESLAEWVLTTADEHPTAYFALDPASGEIVRILSDTLRERTSNRARDLVAL